MGKLHYHLLSRNATAPEQDYENDAGINLFSSQSKIIKPNEQQRVRTDVQLKPPEGHYIQLMGRSGLAEKKIFVHMGVIDCEYTGQIFVLLRNQSEEEFVVNVGDKIVQAVIIKFDSCLEIAESLSDLSKTILRSSRARGRARGSRGFGSTGKKSKFEEQANYDDNKKDCEDDKNSLPELDEVSEPDDEEVESYGDIYAGIPFPGRKAGTKRVKALALRYAWRIVKQAQQELDSVLP